jgi:hypothetical protein
MAAFPVNIEVRKAPWSAQWPMSCARRRPIGSVAKAAPRRFRTNPELTKIAERTRDAPQVPERLAEPNERPGATLPPQPEQDGC